MPQALVAVIPAFVNNLLSTFTDTSLVTVVSMYDLTNDASSQIDAQQTSLVTVVSMYDLTGSLRLALGEVAYSADLKQTGAPLGRGPVVRRCANPRGSPGCQRHRRPARGQRHPAWHPPPHPPGRPPRRRWWRPRLRRPSLRQPQAPIWPRARLPRAAAEPVPRASGPATECRSRDGPARQDLRRQLRCSMAGWRMRSCALLGKLTTKRAPNSGRKLLYGRHRADWGILKAETV